MSDKCDVCGRDDGWHDLRTHAWQAQTQAPLLRPTLDDGSTWNVKPAPEAQDARVSADMLRDALAEIERLRKGKDDEQKCDRSHMVGEARPDLPKHRQAPALAMVADTLDHRLGTPQPDGEPCEPMSARRWRWGVL
jgi:hypothetical protein